MSKWVKVRQGNYKYVGDDDPRPAVIPPKRKIGLPYIKFIPSWRKYEQNFLNIDPDKKSSNEMTDKFIAEREFQTKTDPRAKRWEESRQQEWAKNKPVWRKKMMKEGII